MRTALLTRFNFPDSETFATLIALTGQTRWVFVGILVILLAVILIVHLAAALKHHFIDRDRILTRMIKG